MLDGGNLLGAMTDYYKTFAASMDKSAIRWMRYKDFSTNTPLIAACVALDDVTSSTTPKATLGVACMDVNIIVSVHDLQQVGKLHPRCPTGQRGMDAVFMRDRGANQSFARYGFSSKIRCKS